jgi:Holliday junction resolvase-like predicted endonuclease
MEKKILEKHVQTDCVKWLTARGWIVTKMGLNSQRGWPDLLALRNGQAVFIEVKRPGGQLAPLQVEMAKRLHRSGFVVLCIDDVKALEGIDTLR